MAIGINLEDTTDYYGKDKVSSSRLTKRQKTLLRNRLIKNSLVTRSRVGKRKYDRIARAIRKILNG